MNLRKNSLFEFHIKIDLRQKYQSIIKYYNKMVLFNNKTVELVHLFYSNKIT